jgi:radical SAM superfamily enzyme YgiQ (UPF0313 family)
MNVFFIKPGMAKVGFPHQYAVLSAYVKKMGNRISFYDASLNDESPQRVFEKVDLTDKDVVCMSVLSGWQEWVRSFTSLVKDKYPQIKVIVGGTHISALKELAVEHIGADYGIAGEGEIALGRLLRGLNSGEKPGQIPGLIYKINGSYLHNSAKYERIRDFDDVPLPDYSTVRPDNYFSTYLGASVPRRHTRLVQTVTSRGCPFLCTFCATNATWENKITFYSADRVIEEMKYLVKDFSIKEIWFGDDGFTTDKARAAEICEKMIRENFRLPWRLPNGIRIDTIDENLIRLMKRAGCYMAGIGIETGSSSMMRKIKKNLDLGIIRDKVKVLKRHGILTSGFFIIGFPGETQQELDETIDFILKSNLDRIQICIFTPLPGSEYFNSLFGINDKRKFTDNVKRYLYEGVLPEFVDGAKSTALKKHYMDTLFQFYTKPSILFSLIKNVSLKQIRDMFLHPHIRLMLGLKVN